MVSKSVVAGADMERRLFKAVEARFLVRWSKPHFKMCAHEQQLPAKCQLCNHYLHVLHYLHIFASLQVEAFHRCPLYDASHYAWTLQHDTMHG